VCGVSEECEDCGVEWEWEFCGGECEVFGVEWGVRGGCGLENGVWCV
jgi:hypothetical protein